MGFSAGFRTEGRVVEGDRVLMRVKELRRIMASATRWRRTLTQGQAGALGGRSLALCDVSLSG